MNLDEVVAAIDSFDDELFIFAQLPWNGESAAEVGDVAPDGLETVGGVREAKEKLRHYIGDPAPMRLARIVAHAEAVRAEREKADRAERTFTYGGYAAGVFEDRALPTRPGRYRYVPYRGRGHLLMVEAIPREGAARCRFPNGHRFRIVAIPEYGVLEIRDLDP